jgi:hypothetical protein
LDFEVRPGDLEQIPHAETWKLFDRDDGRERFIDKLREYEDAAEKIASTCYNEQYALYIANAWTDESVCRHKLAT